MSRDAAPPTRHSLVADAMNRRLVDRMAAAREEYAARFDPERRAQARRSPTLAASRIDDSHPPTLERLRLVESVEPATPAVILDAERSAAVDSETERVVDLALRRFADRFRG